MMNFREELEEIKKKEKPKDEYYRLAESFLEQVLYTLKNLEYSKIESSKRLSFHCINFEYISVKLDDDNIIGKLYNSNHIAYIFDAIKDIVKQSCNEDIIFDTFIMLSIKF